MAPCICIYHIVSFAMYTDRLIFQHNTSFYKSFEQRQPKRQVTYIHPTTNQQREMEDKRRLQDTERSPQHRQTNTHSTYTNSRGKQFIVHNVPTTDTMNRHRGHNTFSFFFKQTTTTGDTHTDGDGQRESAHWMEKHLPIDSSHPLPRSLSLKLTAKSHSLSLPFQCSN